MNTFNLLKIYYSGLIKAKLEYRFTFFIQTIATIFGVAVGYLGIWVLLDEFHEIDGWTLFEVLLLYAIGYFCYAVSDMVFGVPMKWLGRWAKQGELDSVLIRPINPLLHVLLKQFSFKFGPIVIASITLMVCFLGLGHSYDTLALIMLPLSLLGGILIEASLMIAVGSLGIRLYETQSATKMLVKDIREFSNYPISIFPTPIIVALMTVVPLAFVNYIPTSYLLGKTDGSAYMMLLPLAVGIACFFLAYRFFMWNVAKYASTGS